MSEKITYQYTDLDNTIKTTTDADFVEKWAKRGVEFSPKPVLREQRFEAALKEIAFPPPIHRGDAYMYLTAQNIAKKALKEAGDD